LNTPLFRCAPGGKDLPIVLRAAVLHPGPAAQWSPIPAANTPAARHPRDSLACHRQRALDGAGREGNVGQFLKQPWLHLSHGA
jgi:hypothetical protein